jgi:hypothetical protein
MSPNPTIDDGKITVHLSPRQCLVIAEALVQSPEEVADLIHALEPCLLVALVDPGLSADVRSKLETLLRQHGIEPPTE